MPKSARNRTSDFQQIACGVGHVMNDFTRRWLNSFRLIFLMKVVSLSATNAGWLVLYNRFVGALIFRPIVGYVCDRVYIPVLSHKLGKRKSWHLVGSVLTVVFVPLFYSTCLVCSSEPSEWQLMVYYCTITTFVTFSHSCIEIAHMSVIPVVAKDQSEAVKLNVLRMAFTFLTGISSYLVALVILGQDGHDQLTPDSSKDFTVMTLIFVGMGLLFTVIFHIGTREPSDQLTDNSSISSTDTTCTEMSEADDVVLKFSVESNGNVQNAVGSGERTPGQCDTEKDDLRFRENPHNTEVLAASTESLGVDNEVFSSDETTTRPRIADQITPAIVDTVDCSVVVGKPFVVSSDPETGLPASQGHKTVRDWLKDPHLYKVAIIYTCTRVLQDISYSYLPLYLTDTLKFEKEAIAYLPLVVLISATISTGITKKLIGKIGNKWSFTLAGVVVIGAAVWFYFITQSSRVSIYPAAVLLGFGFSAMFVNAFSFATELIGDNKSTSGFVFAFLSMVESLAGGSVVMVVQDFFPEESSSSEDCKGCGNYVRHVFSLVPGSLAAISLLIVLLFQASKLTGKRHALQTDATMETKRSMEPAAIMRSNHGVSLLYYRWIGSNSW